MPTTHELWTMIGAIFVTLLLASILLGGCADLTAYKDAEFRYYSHEQAKWGQ